MMENEHQSPVKCMKEHAMTTVVADQDAILAPWARQSSSIEYAKVST
jgi:hypothetical protein